VLKDTAHVAITCAGSPGSSCSVTVQLTVVETIRGGKVIAVIASTTSKRTVIVGASTTSVTAGHNKTVAVSLNATGERLVTARRTLSVKIKTIQGGTQVSGPTITFRAPSV
jgi:hypothetical protein